MHRNYSALLSPTKHKVIATSQQPTTFYPNLWLLTDKDGKIDSWKDQTTTSDQNL